jgi:hypothetical protein
LDRYDAVGWVLLTSWLAASRGQPVDAWNINRAVRNARRSCASFIMDEPLPEPTFPSRAEVRQMVKRKRDGTYDWSPLEDWLEKHPDE